MGGESPFFRLLHLARVRSVGEDNLWSVPSNNGLFGVKSFYSVMGCHDCVCFPWKSVWRTMVLLRVSFFVWLVALGKNLLWIIFKSGTLLWLIGVAYVK